MERPLNCDVPCDPEPVGEPVSPGEAPVFNPDSPAEIRAVLEQMGIGLKKRWGQNFLVNRGARERLVALLDPAARATWRGRSALASGAMTGLLLRRGVRLVAFEVDRGLCRFLRQAHAEEPGFTLVEGDFLETWEDAAAGNDRAGGAPTVVLGNLPYRSASLMIAAIIEGGLRPARLDLHGPAGAGRPHDRGPGVEELLLVLRPVPACFAIEGRGDLQPGSFYPAPEVVSSIVEMRPLPAGPDAKTVACSRGCCGRCSPRGGRPCATTSQSALGPRAEPRAAVAAALEAEGIDLASRAEEVPPEVFAARLARRLAELPTGSSSP